MISIKIRSQNNLYFCSNFKLQSILYIFYFQLCYRDDFILWIALKKIQSLHKINVAEETKINQKEVGQEESNCCIYFNLCAVVFAVNWMCDELDYFSFRWIPFIEFFISAVTYLQNYLFYWIDFIYTFHDLFKVCKLVACRMCYFIRIYSINYVSLTLRYLCKFDMKINIADTLQVQVFEI